MSEHAPQPETKKPASFSDLFPGRFIHADHLKGRTVTLTIADVYREELMGERGAETKAILAFRETPLLLVLAKINGVCIKAILGDDVRAWVGKRIAFYPTSKLAPMGGEECVRVYGSPELARDMEVSYPMPRRKAPVRIPLKAMGKAAAKPATTEHDAEPPREPGDE